MWLQAPENDYRSLADSPAPPPRLRVAVCMPVYNRVDLLARTVAALVPQSYPMDLLTVVVGDDGSDEDVEAALAPLSGRLALAVHRRERDGYGAGQARNLAARAADTDILVFIDSDCLPDPELVARHADWHHRAENLVVIGSRHGLNTSEYDVDRLASGDADLRRAAFGVTALGDADVGQTDHRRVLHRRTFDQRYGDEAFRSLVSSNFSIRRDRFLEVGGFDETFHRWGGEDIELGWRCHTAGLFTVPEDRAIVYHQLQEDTWEETGRDESKARNSGVIQNKIPHSFYRKYRRGHLWEVPKVSMVAYPTVPKRLEELAEQMRNQVYTDWELLFEVNSPEMTLFSEIYAHDPRFRAVDGGGITQLIGQARGEYVGVIHGDAALERRLLSVTVRALENRRRSAMVTCGYRVGTLVLRNLDDLAELDRAWDRTDSGLPVFHLARRREWSKALSVHDEPADAYRWLSGLPRPAHLPEGYVGLRSPAPGADVGAPLPTFTADRSKLHAEVGGLPLRPRSAKALARYLKRRALPAEPAPEKEPEPRRSPSPERLVVRYVGWTGHDNMGDEALLQAITGALDWAEVRTSKRGDLLLLGGGTLINRGSYISWLEEQDSPRIERAVLGTGVASPTFWGDRGESGRWVEWLSTCAYIGVRGPDSAATLESWGVDAEVVGDAALLLEATAPRKEGRVVVAPCRTRGELWGGDDGAVFDRTADVVTKLTGLGHDVWILSAHPDDDGPALDIMRAAGRPDLPYFAGYENLAGAMELMASADVVVAERLHAAVLAAAVSTPFVALEYRPKVRDFSRSVGFDEYTLRTDDLDSLAELTLSAIAKRTELSAQLTDRVAEYRARLRAAADTLGSLMGR